MIFVNFMYLGDFFSWRLYIDIDLLETAKGRKWGRISKCPTSRCCKFGEAILQAVTRTIIDQSAPRLLHKGTAKGGSW